MWNRTSCAQVHELSPNDFDDKSEGTLFPWLHIYNAHLASERFQHSVCRGSLMTSNIMLLALLVQHSLVHWYLQCGTIHQVPKWLSWHKAIVLITRSAHCFHDYIYVTLILVLWDLRTLCVVHHLWPLILRAPLRLLSTLFFIGTSNVEPCNMCQSAWVAKKSLWW